MRNQDLAIVLACATLTFCVLYAPQPLLPRIADTFQVSPADASLMISITLLPLALAPLFYGYLIETFSARTLLRVAMALLAISEFALWWIDQFWGLIAVRLIQGLLLPAVLTGLMTYCSSMSPAGDVRRIMSYYIAATILGGFAGRAASGAIATLAHWRDVFFILGALLGIASLLLFLIRQDNRTDTGFARFEFSAVRDVLRQPLYLQGYLLIFVAYFVFGSVLNFLPFRLKELNPEISELTIGMAYIGYLVGLVIALSSVRISRRLGGESQSVIVGMGLYMAGSAALLTSAVPMVFGAVFIYCAGLFLTHSVLSGLLNHHASEHKGVVNGLYLCFYYAGGALGSYLPGFIYRYFGWPVFIATIMIVIGAGLAIALRMQTTTRACS